MNIKQTEEKYFFDSPWAKIFLVSAFFVSPLIFFTDFTRNPYFFQITLLNISLIFLSVFGIYREGLNFFSFKKTHIKLFLLFSFFFLLSSIFAFFSVSPFFKDSVKSENSRVWLFTLTNCFLPFAAASFQKFSKEENPLTGKFLLFFILWGFAWILFPFLKTQNQESSLFFSFFDFYGAVVWISGFIFVFYSIKKASVRNILILPMLACLFSSAYGVLQYFGIEFIWAKLLTPYGRRAVSTFGNPNFASSYCVMVIPLAIYFLSSAKTFYSKLFYALTLIFSFAMIFASLTRSSLIGVLVALIFVFSFKVYRKDIMISDTAKKTALAVLFVFLLWPDETLRPASMGAAKRLYEGVSSAFSGFSLSLPKDKIYPSFHQRLLIWSAGGKMFSENPLFGRGWGNFELFYPYYQGSILAVYPNLKDLRTHANNAHNEIIEILSQTGIIGFGFYVFFFFYLFKNFYFFVKNAQEDDKKLAISLAAAVAGMIADNMLNVTLHFSQPAFLFWWITGTLSALSCAKSADQSKKNKIFLTVASFFLFICALFWFNQLMREAYYFKGFKYMRKNLYWEAVKDLEKAYSFHGREVNNNYELANAYTRVGEYEKSEKFYLEALKSNAGYDEIFFNLGVVRAKMSKMSEAEKDFRTAIFINPFNKTAYQGLADIYMKNLKEYSKRGAEITERGIGFFPYDPAFYDMAAYFYAASGDMGKSLEIYEKGLIANPYYEPFYRKIISLKKGDKTKSPALDLYFFCLKTDKQIYSDPKTALKEIRNNVAYKYNYFLKYLAAKAFFALGDLESAQKELENSVALREDFADSLYGLASVYEKKGLNAKAGSVLSKILSFEPQNYKAAQKLAELKEKI
ncbi:MAG: tetratricopeptide repeat protein [Elusimicrobia bacterium]|nr:tetratricopeptide repeat protein [Elusimicrobiota bacterium]